MKKYIKQILTFILFTVLIMSLFRINFLFTHTIIELISIVVAISVSIITINSVHIINNSFFIFLSISYFFVGFTDLIHTLAYKDLGIIIFSGADVSAQTWLVARFMESIGFLVSLEIIKIKVKAEKIVFFYSTFLLLAVLSIYQLELFPICYIEGKGLTNFKVYSEYLIIFILIISLLVLYKKKENFSDHIYKYLQLSIIFTIISELSFTFYIGVFDFSNALGHVFKLYSFIFIYKAIIESSLKNPLEFLLNFMDEDNKKLLKENKELEDISDKLLSTIKTKTDDILKEKQKVIKANKIKYEIINGVSHELKTPLNIVMGFTEMLMKDKSLDERVIKKLKLIKKNEEELLRKIEKILLFSDENTKLTESDINIDFKTVIEEILLYYKTEIDKKGLNIDLNVSIDHEICIKKEVITEIFTNLIENSLKFTDHGNIKIEVYKESKEYYVFKITDTGIGIEKDKVNEMFELFRQEDGSIDKKFYGLGLGLPIVKSLVNKLNGKIEVFSEKGKGSSFKIYLPFVIS